MAVLPVVQRSRVGRSQGHVMINPGYLKVIWPNVLERCRQVAMFWHPDIHLGAACLLTDLNRKHHFRNWGRWEVG